MRTVPSRRSTQAQPAEGRPGPSDNYDDDYVEDDDVGDNDVDDDDDKKMKLAYQDREVQKRVEPG